MATTLTEAESEDQCQWALWHPTSARDRDIHPSISVPPLGQAFLFPLPMLFGSPGLPMLLRSPNVALLHAAHDRLSPSTVVPL